MKILQNPKLHPFVAADECERCGKSREEHAPARLFLPWIPMSKKTPEEGRMVLCFGDLGVSFGRFGYGRNGPGFELQDGRWRMARSVSHWCYVVPPPNTSQRSAPAPDESAAEARD